MSAGLESLDRVIASFGAERLSGRGGARASDHALRDAVGLLVREARERDGVQAENVLIDLRQRWVRLPSVQRLARDGARRDLWDRLVLLCCEEFYASPRRMDSRTNDGARS